MTSSQLSEVVEAHVTWLLGNSGGVRADLSNAKLIGANLRDANLREAILRGADLRGADLRAACLMEADLCAALLIDARLAGADLCYASLRDASLVDADLAGANLCGADLRGAYLTDAWLDGAIIGARSIVPEDGAFIAWTTEHLVRKSSLTRFHDLPATDRAMKIEICADARRVSPLTGRTCRASKVRLIESDVIGVDVVMADEFDPDIRQESANGIRFFVTRWEAESCARRMSWHA